MIGGYIMQKVLTVGVFDYFHLGHLRLFENAKQLGDYLIVALQDNDFILKYTLTGCFFNSTISSVLKPLTAL